jgi:iron uptake system EfeUOB component EfeO/EfeM
MRDISRSQRSGAVAAAGRPGLRRVAWSGRLSALLAVVVLAATAGGAAASSAVAGGSLTVDETACGTPPAQMPAGRVAFTVTDEAGSSTFATVYVIGLNGLVYAEISSLAPEKALPLDTTLSAGDYAVRCVFSDGAVLTSTPISVTGSTTGAVAGYQPMPDLAMTGPIDAYRDWVQAALPRLLAACSALDADVAQGNLAAARTDWLTAHLDYERLGVAYNSFGDFDDELNGMAKGLPEGVATPDWTGFFSIEYALWHNWSPTEVRPLTKNLVTTVDALIQDFPSEEIDPGDLPLRSHEILENALQFQLTGIADYGSGTTLATTYANTQGTAEVLSTLTGLIRPRDPALLTAIDQDLAQVQAELLAQRASDGTWTPLGKLSTAARQRIDGDLGNLLEQLSVIPNLLAPRTSA